MVLFNYHNSQWRNIQLHGFLMSMPGDTFHFKRLVIST
ncbi:MAG: hypothetical protein ACJAUO_002543, partial [Sediminicola sp.]